TGRRGLPAPVVQPDRGREPRRFLRLALSQRRRGRHQYQRDDRSGDHRPSRVYAARAGVRGNAGGHHSLPPPAAAERRVPAYCRHARRARCPARRGPRVPGDSGRGDGAFRGFVHPAARYRAPRDSHLRGCRGRARAFAGARAGAPGGLQVSRAAAAARRDDACTRGRRVRRQRRGHTRPQAHPRLRAPGAQAVGQDGRAVEALLRGRIGTDVRKVCIFIGSRANYSSIKSVMRAVRAHPQLQLQLIVGASALLDRFGSVIDVIEEDGFKPDARVTMIVEGETPATMAKSTGLGLIELPTMFEMLKPDVVVSVGDRFETMATAIAAAYMNIPVAHTMGGEISGTIDESIRHAVTKLSHLHFPANAAAAERIIRMGEAPDTVHAVGCPRIDLVAEIAHGGADLPHAEWLEREGVGAHVDVTRPFLLVNQHPVTTEYGQGKAQVWETLMALDELRMPTIMLWPNVDAGSDDIASGMRTFREKLKPEYIRFYKNFPIDTYVRLMLLSVCAV